MDLPIKGVIPPMVTPLLDHHELDLSGLENLISHLLNGGVHGIFLLGTNGEGPSLGYGTRKKLITESCNMVSGQVPVLVGISDTSFEGSIEIAKHAEKAGADALVVAPPYYFPINQEEMGSYLELLAPHLPLPFLLYDIPSCTKLHLSPPIVEKAKELGAIGVKDSSGDLTALYTLIDTFKDSPGFSVIAGAEIFLPETVLHGGHGAVAGGANIFPKFFVDLYKASCSKDFDHIKSLRQKLLQIHRKLYSIVDSPTGSMKVIKAALALMNICSDYMAPPLKQLSAENRLEIQRTLGDLDGI